jgi:hypothetical protein
MNYDRITVDNDLPGEAGSQGLHIVAFFQDLSQVRARWGPEQAEGFLSLFGAKGVLPNIMDPATLDAISKALGEQPVWLEEEAVATARAAERSQSHGRSTTGRCSAPATSPACRRVGRSTLRESNGPTSISSPGGGKGRTGEP